MSETEIQFQGLTHQCDDAECHVPGFVTTLERRGLMAPGDQWRPSCSCGAPIVPTAPTSEVGR